MRPFLYWAGNKRRQAVAIADLVRTGLRPTGTYHELFAGSAAVALELQHQHTHLADTNADLIKTYAAVVSYPNIVQVLLDRLTEQPPTEALYYEVRDTYNNTKMTLPKHAAHFIYLNRTGFSGLYRVNALNYFNVPYGQRKAPVFPVLKPYSDAMKSWRIVHAPFDVTLVEAKAGDVVYLDPPYDGTFDAYQRQGFTQDDHRCLAECVADAQQRGVRVIMTNADNDFVRQTFSTLAFTALAEHRGFRGKTDGAKAPCLLGISP